MSVRVKDRLHFVLFLVSVIVIRNHDIHRVSTMFVQNLHVASGVQPKGWSAAPIVPFHEFQQLVVIDVEVIVLVFLVRVGNGSVTLAFLLLIHIAIYKNEPACVVVEGSMRFGPCKLALLC